MFADLASFASASADQGAELRLSGGRLATLLDTIALVRELSALADVVEPVSTPEGLEQRLNILLSVAAKSAEITQSQTDDAWIAKVRAELMEPEVLGFIAYLLRRSGN
jgi:hypothetical protein